MVSRRTNPPATSSPPAPERAQLPGFMVNWAARLFGRAFNRRLAAMGASVGQWPVLLALLHEDGLTQSELTRRLDLEQPTVANTVKRMERDRLIERTPHARDRRQEHLHLTDRARGLAPRFIELADEVNRLALTGLTAGEAQTLMRLLHRVIDNLRSESPAREHHREEPPTAPSRPLETQRRPPGRGS